MTEAAGKQWWDTDWLHRLPIATPQSDGSLKLTRAKISQTHEWAEIITLSARDVDAIMVAIADCQPISRVEK